MESNDVIKYYLNEIEIEDKMEDKIEDEIDINELLNQSILNENKIINETVDINFKDEMLFPQMINYSENYTVKELLLICDYYGFAKDLKINKFNKEQIICFLVEFELNIENSEIVCKRQNLWFYINELKQDKFMKKYILW
jgi:hypothetical protein